MAAVKRNAKHLISRAEMARKLGVTRAAVTNACYPGERLAPACEGSSVNVLHEAAQRWLLERGAQLDQAARATPRAATPELLDQRRRRPPPRAAAPAPAPEPARTPRRAAPDPASSPAPAPAPRASRRRPPPPPEPIELEPIEVDADEPEPEASRSVEDLEDQLGALRGIDLADLAEPLTVLTEKYQDVKEFEAWIRARKALEEARKAQMLRERLEGRLIARTTVNRMFDHVDTAFRLLLSDAPRAIATRIAPQDVAAVAALIREQMSQHLATARGLLDQSLANDDPMAPLAEAAE